MSKGCGCFLIIIGTMAVFVASFFSLLESSGITDEAVLRTELDPKILKTPQDAGTLDAKAGVEYSVWVEYPFKAQTGWLQLFDITAREKSGNNILKRYESLEVNYHVSSGDSIRSGFGYGSFTPEADGVYNLSATILDREQGLMPPVTIVVCTSESRYGTGLFIFIILGGVAVIILGIFKFRQKPPKPEDEIEKFGFGVPPEISGSSKNPTAS